MIAEAKTWLRAHGLQMALEVLVNFVLPLVVFSFAQPRLGDVKALLASSAPPLVWSLAEFARYRRVDAVSMLVLAGIALAILAFFGGGSVKFLQLRENLVTGVIGCVFLGSAMIGKPLIFQLAKAGIARRSQAEAEAFAQRRDNHRFRRVMMIMTLVWGVGLVASAGLSCVLVFVLTIRDYMIVSPIVGYATMGGLALWTVLYRRHVERRAARTAGAAGAAGTAPDAAG